ncbi:MAG TPA: ABC transporter permease [Acidimicrobiales bacterium]|nr:ABC transporter permease [Acidimicrobiales bacterium]
MSEWFAACSAGLRLQARQFGKARVIICLTVVEALTFLFLVSLFGLTGSKAPTAIIMQDHGALAQSFVTDLRNDHHSFRLEVMGATEAKQLLDRGDLVAIITIPADFSSTVRSGHTAAISVAVDNVDADLTDDIQRAVPAAIETFGVQHHFGGIRVAPAEHDLIGHDTAYIPYLVVSALALDALVVAGALAATAMAGEWENRTLVQWRLAPASMTGVLIGKLITVVAVSTVAVWMAALLVFFGYGVHPHSLPGALSALVLCTVIFAAIGACVGNLLRKTLPVATLFFGLALPLYIDSGSLEPERFDGGWLWFVAHLTPVYAAVGVLQSAINGLKVTPEPVAVDLGILLLWAVAAVAVAHSILQRARRAQ